MSPELFFILLKVVSAIVMLFQLRSLMQSSAVDYYHPFTQAVTKLTNPLVNISIWRNVRIFNFAAAGFVVAYLIALVFWLVMSIVLMNTPIFLALIGSVFMFIKNLGLLIIFVLLGQALCSWLPATHNLSYLFAQTVSFITRPVQRIIPPIGMIDISLMVVVLSIYALNGLISKILFSINLYLGQLWAFV